MQLKVKPTTSPLMTYNCATMSPLCSVNETKGQLHRCHLNLNFGKHIPQQISYQKRISYSL